MVLASLTWMMTGRVERVATAMDETINAAMASE
jgi:hypothetical protein